MRDSCHLLAISGYVRSCGSLPVAVLLNVAQLLLTDFRMCPSRPLARLMKVLTQLRGLTVVAWGGTRWNYSWIRLAWGAFLPWSSS